MDAKSILDRVAEAYGGCASYFDKGRHTTSHSGQEYMVTFQTNFVRPSKFRFDWWWSYRPYSKQKKPQFHDWIWCDGKRAFSRLHFKKRVQEEQSVQMAIAGATGISSGTACAVSSLLSPSLIKIKRKWTDLHNPVVRNEEFIFGFECFLVNGSLDNADDTELWIDQKTYLIRKVVEPHVHDCFEYSDVQVECKIEDNIFTSEDFEQS